VSACGQSDMNDATIVCRKFQNEVLGTFRSKRDPCRLDRVDRPMERMPNSTLKQTATSGQKTALNSDAGGSGGSRRNRKRRTEQRQSGGRTLVQEVTLVDSSSSGAVDTDSGAAEDAGTLTASVPAASTHLAQSPKFVPVQPHNSTLKGKCLGSMIACQDVVPVDDAKGLQHSVWRSRPAIMHKVVMPLHLHYLHWRLRHCSIPEKDLLSPPAMANALADIPANTRGHR
jgi:hypothetical protein